MNRCIKKYYLDEYDRVLEESMPEINFGEDTSDYKATMKIIDDDGIKHLLQENRKLKKELNSGQAVFSLKYSLLQEKLSKKEKITRELKDYVINYEPCTVNQVYKRNGMEKLLYKLKELEDKYE